jgi:hypothetical protein
MKRMNHSLPAGLCAFVAAFGLASALTMTLGAYRVSAQPVLIVDVIDTVALPNTQNTVISIFVDNFSDTVAGVELWIQLDRPDVIVFQTNVDTIPDTSLWRCLTGTFPNCTDSVQVFDTIRYWSCQNPIGAVPPACLDSIEVADTLLGYDWFTTIPYDFLHVVDKEIILGNFDTSGTLMSGWEFVDARSLGGQGFDVKVSALANQAALPVTPGFGPQNDGVLIKILADVILDDTATDRTVNMRIVSSTLNNFSFSDEIGNSIGIVTDSVVDTAFWFCNQWDVFDTTLCLDYIRVPTPPFDSLSTDIILVGRLDTSKVILSDGSLTILVPPACICGDVNEDTKKNIADITYMIARIFSGGPSPMCGGVPSNLPADPNGDCKFNIADITYMIAWIFSGGSGPNGCCLQ